MRISIIFFFCLVIGACDSTRVFEENTDFEKRNWITTENPTFVINVPDHQQPYNIKVNFRNSLGYPKANLYYRFTLLDSTGSELEKKLLNNFLFDEKTGEPLGSSGLGDIFDHQFPVLENYQFKYAGEYSIQLAQFMRMDTLPGVLSAGIRVEKVAGNN
jgi:gliding motility-associated lipoprotein GldH